MPKSVLIVASDASVQKELEQILRAVENIEVTVTARGNEALGLATRLKPALIFVDVHLAEESGYDVCREIKRSLPGVSVILISSSAVPFDWKEAAVAGADSRLSVPFEHPEVALDRIYRYLSEHGGRKSAGRMSSETRLVLDLMTHRASSILWAELARRLHPEHVDRLKVTSDPQQVAEQG
jgi:DNA-binding response OmpR family regulator